MASPPPDAAFSSPPSSPVVGGRPPPSPPSQRPSPTTSSCAAQGTAPRPGASSPPPSRRPSRLVRVYLDGPFGVGKTSALDRLCGKTLGAPAIRAYEPMRYWRCLFSDAVSGVYEASRERSLGRITDAQTDAAVVALQLRFAEPYLALDARCAGRLGPLSRSRGRPDLVLLFDRHPLAATLCFPAARCLLGDCAPESVLALAARTPRAAPGTNLLVMRLDDEAEHMRRVRDRARPGETADPRMARALRVVYDMLVRTVDYVNNAEAGPAGRKRARDDADEERRRRRPPPPPSALGDARRAPSPASREWWEGDWLRAPWMDGRRRESLLAPRTAARDGDAATPPAPLPRTRSPPPESTLLGLFKAAPLCDESGRMRRVHAWALTELLSKLVGVWIDVVAADGKTTYECAAAIGEAVSVMPATLPSAADRRAVEDAILTFNWECA